jgi:hypothetical protein
MLVLGPVVNEKEYPRGGEAIDQAVEKGLGFGIAPVKILEDKQKGLNLTLPQQQTFDGVEHPLTPLRRIEVSPLRIVNRRLEQSEESW